MVVVEAPTYDRTLLALRQMGAEVLAIPLEADGIDVEALEQALEGGARPKLAHVIPNFHNPAGCTLSLKKRERLIELAEQYDFVLFEDDPYVELRFTGEQLPTMLSMDETGKVVYASSFSKTVCPGIRVGYLAGPAELIGQTRKLATSTYISPSMVAQSIVAEFCESGAIDRSIETVKNALRERRTCSAGAREELPEAEFVVPEGGYFLWIDLPEGTDVARIAELAGERGVVFVKGVDFLHGGRRELAADRLLRRARRPDRRGGLPPGGGLPGRDRLLSRGRRGARARPEARPQRARRGHPAGDARAPRAAARDRGGDRDPRRADRLRDRARAPHLGLPRRT